MCCDFIPFSTVFHETGQKYLLPDMTKCSWHNMRYCSGLPSVRFRSGFLPCNCTATRTFSVQNNWFPMSCLFVLSVPVADHTGQNLPIYSQLCPDSDILRGGIPADFHIPAVTKQNDIFLFLTFQHYLTDPVSGQFEFWVLFCPHTITGWNWKTGIVIIFPDQYVEHQADKTVPAP